MIEHFDFTMATLPPASALIHDSYMDALQQHAR